MRLRSVIILSDYSESLKVGCSAHFRSTRRRSPKEGIKHTNDNVAANNHPPIKANNPMANEKDIPKTEIILTIRI